MCENCEAKNNCPFYDGDPENDECVYEVLAAMANKRYEK